MAASSLWAQTVIPLSQATSPTLPAASGDGVFIDVFNGIGGGGAPTPAAIASVPVTGTTLSPYVDFPNPGNTISVGQSFTTFFASTTRPPDQLTAVAARNFILRITTLLRIENSLDRDTNSPGIDVRLGVGSDDGFHLTVGSTFLGQTGDRGFSYSYFDVRFEAEGLYPVTLLFSANSIGASGLTFAWITSRNSGALEIIPQQFLYLTSAGCSRQVLFEEYAAGTTITDQYGDRGLIFDVTGGDMQVTNAQPSKFVPVSPDRVFADPAFPPVEPGSVEFTFVVPGTTTAAATSYFSFYVIDAESTGAGVTAYDTSGAVVFNQTYHGGGASREQVVIEESSIAKVAVTLGDANDTSAIDNICFATPLEIVPPVIADIVDHAAADGLGYTGPTPNLTSGTMPVAWSLVSGPDGMTIDPATGVVSWSDAALAGNPHEVTIRASNTTGADDETWLLTVVTAPGIVEVADATINEAVPYEVALQVNADAGQVAWSLIEGPAGLSIDPNSGVVTWAGPTRTGSPHTVTVEASNIAGSDQESWLLTVLSPPVIAQIADAATASGAPYTGPTPQLVRGLTPVAWSLAVAPAGTTIDPDTGLVSWPSPTVAGSPHTITIRATNAEGSDEETWLLTVQDAPQIADIADTLIRGGEPLYTSPTPVLLKGTPPIAWSLVSGPAGATINPSTGVVTWPTPSEVGSPHTIAIRASNAVGSDDETWQVGVQLPPIIAEIPDDTIAEGVPYSVTPQLTRSTPPVAWSLLTGPAGMTINPTTGTVNWASPTGTAEPYFIVIRASDSQGSDTESWRLGVPVSYTATVSASIDEAPAGTPVMLQGVATLVGSGDPAANVSVTIRIRVQSTRRVITALTNSQGQFQALFQPLANEAGRYFVGADHPAIATDKTDDEFTLYGMQCTPNQVAEQLTPGDLPRTKEVTLRNLGDTPLTGLTASLEGVAANLSVQVNPPTGLAVFGTAPLRYTIVAQDASVQQSSFVIRMNSTEGAVATLTVDARVSPLVPHLVARPASLSAGMLRGEQTLVEFEVLNDGGVTSQAVQVQIPSVPWLALATPTTMDGLAPGGKAPVVIALSPANDLPLGPYQGSLQVSTNLSTVNVPFTFTCISDRRGDVRVTAVDEYTYWAAGSPKIEGATVKLSHPQTGQLVASGTTGVDGTVLLQDLVEAYYAVEVTAPSHGTFRSQVLASGGQIKDVLAFLPRQVVTYNWTVVPIQFEDEYRIVIEAVFETHVPAPVITIDPPFVDLTTIGCDAQIDFTITNHGLIAAQAAQFVFANNNSRYELTPLVEQIGDIPANGTAVVPVRIHDRLCSNGSPIAADSSVDQRAMLASYQANGPNLCASPTLQLKYTLICGVPVPYFVPVGFRLVPGNCPGGGGGIRIPPGGPGGGGLFVVPPSVPSTPGCCDEGTCDCLKAIAECAIGFTPLGCPYGLFQNCVMNSSNDWVRDVISCVGDGLILGCLAGEVPILGQALGAAQCACNINNACNLSSCKPPCDLASIYDRMTKGGGLCGSPGGSPSPQPAGKGLVETAGASVLAPPQRLSAAYDRLLATLGPAAYFFGNPAWLGVSEQDTPLLGAWLAQFSQMTQPGSDADDHISAAERQALLAMNKPNALTIADLEQFLDRYNRTLDYNAAGIFDESQVPEGESTDFIVRTRMLELYEEARVATAAVQAEGFDGPLQALSKAKDDYQAYKASNQEQGVCARVRIQIDQRAVISRSAFKATLELENGGDAPLEDISVQIDIRDADDIPANDRFGTYPPVLTNLSDVDGTGSVAPASTGKAEWTLLPGDTAAPADPAQYFVGGTLQYSINGVPVTIPLFPAEITVLPNPSLYLKYFLEREVHSDDPFTPEVEPAVPFSLGLIAHNAGAGVASNFRITSSQPKIIENEKGLQIDFVIIGTKVGGQSYSPSLTANLGDLGPNQAAVAQWLMTSTLQGKFIEYSATFEHVNGLGDEQFSILDGVEIHEMLHVVRVDQPSDDGLPDFLVNDVADPDGLPDTIHSSTNAVLPVSAVLDGTVDQPVSMDRLEVHLTASMPAGWTYVRVNNPAGPDFQLTRVLRPNGSELRVGDNVWTTHRAVRIEGQPPREENFLHLIDRDGPGTYTLVYAPVQPPSAADLDGNGTVDGIDWGLFLAARGHAQGDPAYLPAADLDDDGIVSFADQQLWIAAYRLFTGNPTALPPAPITLTEFVGDIDGDNDIDAVDFGVLQRCWSGSGAAQRTPGCELARLDGDLDVDLNDLSRLISCSNGPRISPPDNCRR